MEVSWLFFSGGLIFWMVLLTLVMNRLMFHDPLPGKMVPTLMILIAPHAVAFAAWLRLTGEVGHFGHFLLAAAYVFTLLVATQSPGIRTMPFALVVGAVVPPCRTGYRKLRPCRGSRLCRPSFHRGRPAGPAAGRCHRADPAHGPCDSGGNHLPAE